ncbi:MAG: class F sortase [Acidimicrobiales bacterium]
MALSRKGRRAASIIGAVMLLGGIAAVSDAALSQNHAPQPTGAQAGHIGPLPSESPVPPSSRTGKRTPGSRRGLKAKVPAKRVLARSVPVSVDIPSVGIQSALSDVGLNSNGTIEVPNLYAKPSKAAWYDGSATPGEAGTSVIEGHIDTYEGPSVFFRLGSLHPGADAYVTLADGVVAVFKVTAVRQFQKSAFPTLTVYGNTPYPSLRLITCGGSFDSATHGYLANTVVFADLISSHQAT